MLKIKLLLFAALLSMVAFAQVPPEQRGNIAWERMGHHDFNNIRTRFYNYGMVGDYPPDPLKVDLTVFHSVEIPKGSGENYTDGITPFVLAKIRQNNGRDAYIMESGYRERQTQSPLTGKTMRYEPRPGYLQEDPTINVGRSVAISNDPRTWPDLWPDKMNDATDPGWHGWWNGYFGKVPKLEMQESYVVMDDNYYDAWDFYPDSRDHTRRGLGLRIEQRGFQWNNPQAADVIFFHYEITNESTTDYDDNIIFGLYMDSGVGGSGKGIDPYPESDDDNAYFTKEEGLNLVYTWDYYGHGVKGPTGYLGYSYLETPGNQYDGKDNDDDGIIDEKRDSGPGIQITGQDNLRNYVNANYNTAKFTATYGPLESRPAFKKGIWWTGDEDLDWVQEFCDTGADGLFGTNDEGENDGIPTPGEPNFDALDLDESDQVGLTGFKYNRINDPAGGGPTDNIVFFDDGRGWPERLWRNFTNPDSAFDAAITRTNLNIAFLFASGPFKLPAGKSERFSLALAFGRDLRELKENIKVVSKIYKANYQFAVPPPTPTLKAFAGDGYVTLSWDEAAERAYDPVTGDNDFEGYKIYRSTDPNFNDIKTIYSGTGTEPMPFGRALAQFDLKNDIQGYSSTTVKGVAYFLGEDSGIKHTFTDTSVVNGQQYYYAVVAYDHGSDSLGLYPSENAYSVTRTLRGGTVLPKNVVEVVPNPNAMGYVPATTENIVHSTGYGTGTVNVKVVNPAEVPDNHLFKVTFFAQEDSIKAELYRLIDETAGDTLFRLGSDFLGEGTGPTAKGLLPVISTLDTFAIDLEKTGFIPGSPTNSRLITRYSAVKSVNLKRNGFPRDLKIVFSDQVIDTSRAFPGFQAKPAKFKIFAVDPDGSTQRLAFKFYDKNNSGTLDETDDYIEVQTFQSRAPNTPIPTWNVRLDPDYPNDGSARIPPSKNDEYYMKLNIPFGSGDEFTFRTVGQKFDQALANQQFSNKPYVVPNPYVAAASFEPQRYGVQGRGERKMEFRNLPPNCTIRIYTVTGELVQTLHHDGNILQGVVPWDLRTKDNLEVAPGLYIYHVDAGEAGTFIDKFAIVK
ncbi:MAG: hypothetical protein LC102_05280 [Ignavibacteriales bacterium]|nr:MAG: hypothetical protein F9K26_06825 [Ignavibacteriaceae bacterium]MBW7873178.1 hypothetical protein [Ignavibacteria bacterium]MCZ2142820.1 hypothetical protein [Ignavibacteriales bacterium]OQY79377.1 MAG: hypothetical protein B6D45_00840 [Ignavibacteriales bacterium UTCHB3]MBV6443913.1 hypothetical protein [Ignavibacteriaceae bacterium]